MRQRKLANWGETPFCLQAAHDTVFWLVELKGYFSLCGQNGDFTRGILGNTGLVHFLGLLCTICEIISLWMVNVSQSKLYIVEKPIHVSSRKICSLGYL